MGIQVTTGQRSALDAMIALHAQILNADEVKKDGQLARLGKAEELRNQSKMMTNINMAVAQSIKDPKLQADLVKAANEREKRDADFLEKHIDAVLK